MNKDAILKHLLLEKKRFISGAELAGKFNISRTAVWKHIKALEREGFGIEGVPSRGYRLVTVPDVLSKSAITQGRSAQMMGREIHLFRELASTNTVAMELARDNAPEGAVVLAEAQTGGKGRLGRTWISPAGNLYVSVVLRPNISPYRAPLVTLAGAIAVAWAIRKQLGIQANIKWPNDIMIANKKVAGILTEMSADPDRVKYLVLGIGINVNVEREALTPEIRLLATSLISETGSKIDRVAFLNALLTELEQWYTLLLEDDAAVLREWKSLNMTTGRRVAVRSQDGVIEGLARGIDREGRLIIELDGGAVHNVASGDVTIVKEEGPVPRGKGQE
ncbi:MAG TPA: biotin--[acetyl-CoA-carboxylase] ligase [Nitrospiraceae bacterium]|nr:biotin--[acetyl-CoA-carboxylase] ligase [Nitrospiraceae bacterium]